MRNLFICGFVFLLLNTYMQAEIYLSFLGCKDIDKQKVFSEVNKVYSLEIKELNSLKDIDFAHNPKRNQYLADRILSALENFLPNSNCVLVLVVDKDLYTEGFNYIFGLAGKNVSVVSIYRFKPCTVVDTQKEQNLLTERTIKTIIHEIGHCFGLSHCLNPKCVMYFSNWVGDTDKKGKDFCTKCKNKILKK